MAFQDTATTRIDDRAFRQGMVLLRWAITGAYIGMALSGVLEVTRVALLLSAGPLVAHHAYFTYVRLIRARGEARTLFIIRHADVMMTTGVLMALGDVESPVWAVYFISIVGAAHFQTRREMLAYCAWIVVNYVFAAGAVAALDGGVSWSYVALILVILAFLALNAMVLAGGEQRVRDVMAYAARTDSLTGLPNRHCFHESYTAFLDDALARGLPLTLMLLDVDHFKLINDRDGHPAGDDKLRDVASALQSVMRETDMVARYGGDEFIVVAPRTTRDDGVRLAERLGEAARACNTSISVGVAVFPEDAQTHDTLIASADVALYRAKQAGRNCVRTAVAA